MKFSICEVCLNSDIFCSGCDQKIKDGKISQLEVDVSRTLFSFIEKHSSLAEAKLVKVMDSDFLLIITGKGDGPKFVGKKGSIVKELAKKFDRSVRVIEEGDLREFSKNLIFPAPVLGVNIAFTKNGDVHRIRLPALHKGRLAVSEQSFSSIVKELFNKHAELVFE